MNTSILIAEFCRNFRTDVLQITLKELGELSSTNIKTLSAFENGRSTNIDHVIKYLLVSNEQQKTIFIDGLRQILTRV